MSRFARALRVAALFASVATPANAADPPVKAGDPDAKAGAPPAEDWQTDRPALRYDVPLDATVTVVTGATFLTLTLLEPTIAPK